MKRIWIAFALAMLMVLSACGQQVSVQDAGTADAPSGMTWQEQYDLGMRYLSEGNYAEAIIAFTAAIEIDPKQALAYVGRGQAYIFSGETEENLAASQADYEKAIELDETNPDAYLGLADVYVRRGDYEKALEILREGFEKTNNNQSIADKMADIEEEFAMLHPASRFPEILELNDEEYMEITDDMEESLNRIISVGVSGNYSSLREIVAEERTAIGEFIRDADFSSVTQHTYGQLSDGSLVTYHTWGQLSDGSLIILDGVGFHEEGRSYSLEYRPISGKGFIYYYYVLYHYYYGEMRDWLWNGAFEGVEVEADTNEVWRVYEGHAVDEFYDGELLIKFCDDPGDIMTRHYIFSKGADQGWPEGANEDGDIPLIKDVYERDGHHYWGYGKIKYWGELRDHLWTVGLLDQ